MKLPLRLIALALAAVALLSACSSASTQDADRTDDGAIESESELGVFRLRVGDCFEQPGTATQVETLTAVPCDEPHTAEVLDVYDYVADGDTFPGTVAFEESAAEECVNRFNSITGNDFMTDPDWNMTSLYPSAESWDRADDREIVCIVVPLDGEPVSAPIARR